MLNLITALSLLTLTAQAAPSACPAPRFSNDSLETQAGEAIAAHNLDCVKELIARGADQQRIEYGLAYGGLATAARAGDVEITNYMLSLGAKFTNSYVSDVIAVTNMSDDIAAGGSVEVLKIDQAQAGFPLEEKINHWEGKYRSVEKHFTPNCSPILHEAVSWLRPEMITYLASQGVDMNGRCSDEANLEDDSEASPTPLLAVTESLRFSIQNNAETIADANATVKALIEAGADLSARSDISGETAYARILKAKWLTREMAAYVRAHVKK